MAAELVNLATSDKLPEVDWTKNIEICELVGRDQRQARDVVKAIKKRLGSKNPNAQLYAVMLLEMLMNNIGEPVHKEVIDTGVLPILVKIVKKKTDLPVRERIFLLLDATQTSLGGSSGKFPQYYSAYYDLVSAGVQFPQRPPETQTNNPTSQSNKRSTLNGELVASRHEEVAQKAEAQVVPESSIIQKASNVLEVFKEVLDAVDSQNPEGAKDEFTLDLVEQCSFQKQRVMHLVMTSRLLVGSPADSNLYSFQKNHLKVLNCHANTSILLLPVKYDWSSHSQAPKAKGPIGSASLESPRGTTIVWKFTKLDVLGPPMRSNNLGKLAKLEQPKTAAERIVFQQMFQVSIVLWAFKLWFYQLRLEADNDVKHMESIYISISWFKCCPFAMLDRLRKGKACARPVDEVNSEERLSMGLLGSSIAGERLNRPLIRPIISSDQPHEPLVNPPPVAIPPPPAKHVERERFFQEKKVDGSGVTGHMRGLSLHSRNASSSRSGSIDFSD
ncbi:TOM1-like protein 5 [Jatropha curcas]|uniref:TOM1-like protein 5 n=1 Tax=Jatropha curcas TaxID=180498 RepID=UPI001895DEDF|nr:TOM1-like protein 5 [Jatropha curcas]